VDLNSDNALRCAGSGPAFSKVPIYDLMTKAVEQARVLRAEAQRAARKQRQAHHADLPRVDDWRVRAAANLCLVTADADYALHEVLWGFAVRLRLPRDGNSAAVVFQLLWYKGHRVEPIGSDYVTGTGDAACGTISEDDIRAMLQPRIPFPAHFRHAISAAADAHAFTYQFTDNGVALMCSPNSPVVLQIASSLIALLSASPRCVGVYATSLASPNRHVDRGWMGEFGSVQEVAGVAAGSSPRKLMTLLDVSRTKGAVRVLRSAACFGYVAAPIAAGGRQSKLRRCPACSESHAWATKKAQRQNADAAATAEDGHDHEAVRITVDGREFTIPWVVRNTAGVKYEKLSEVRHLQCHVTARP
jgi:hypothetical protein